MQACEWDVQLILLEPDALRPKTPACPYTREVFITLKDTNRASCAEHSGPELSNHFSGQYGQNHHIRSTRCGILRPLFLETFIGLRRSRSEASERPELGGEERHATSRRSTSLFVAIS